MPHPRIQQLIGDNDTDLRHRLLSALLLMMAVAFLVFSVFDFMLYAVTNPLYWILDAVFSAACLLLYYLCFYKNKFVFALYAAFSTTYIMILSVWYNMGGMSTSVGVSFVVFICYFTFILEKKWYVPFLLSNCTFIMLLVALELNFPALVATTTDIEDELIQQGITVFGVCMVLFVGIYIIKSSHDYEKQQAAAHRKRKE